MYLLSTSAAQNGPDQLLLHSNNYLPTVYLRLIHTTTLAMSLLTLEDGHSLWYDATRPAVHRCYLQILL